MLIFNLVSPLLLTAVTAVLGGNSLHGQDVLESFGALSADVAEDAKLDVIGLLTKYGYAAESHEVETEDGYLLTVHRIPGRKGEALRNKPVVLLMHGLLSSSADWITSGPGNDAFGYVLANEGYDVWMGNARGSYYSRKHKSLNPEESTFWRFSWHEIGLYDCAAIIDHALEVTGQEKLHYVGHSQGTTTFFVLMSERPEYNKKIKLMQAFAPVAYMSNVKTPIVKVFFPYINSIHSLLKSVGTDELFGPNREVFKVAERLICHDDTILQPFCSSAFFLLGGFNKDLLNATLLPIVVGHIPAGASRRQMIHYGQLYNSGKFRKYDFGKTGNLLRYLQPTPPDYKLGLVTAPVGLFFGDGDFQADPIDVKQLYKELGNPIEMFKVPHPEFSHYDFLWAIGVKSLLYDHAIELLNKYN